MIYRAPFLARIKRLLPQICPNQPSFHVSHNQTSSIISVDHDRSRRCLPSVPFAVFRRTISLSLQNVNVQRGLLMSLHCEYVGRTTVQATLPLRYPIIATNNY
eukprot:scaffold9603_cov64-Cyclotella_meneghiniana.AAC.1